MKVAIVDKDAYASVEVAGIDEMPVLLTIGVLGEDNVVSSLTDSDSFGVYMTKDMAKRLATELASAAKEEW